MRIMDLSHVISESTPAYPGTVPARLTPANTIEKDGFRETLLQIYSHTGTHMDAPAHMLSNGMRLDEMPVERFVGRAYVFDCSAIEPGGEIPAAALRAVQLAGVDFLLLSSGYEEKWESQAYFDAFPVLSREALEYLLTFPIRGIGADMMSVDPMDGSSFPNHIRLFEKGLCIVENLCNLIPLRGRTVGFAALPLHYRGADGAPVRALAAY